MQKTIQKMERILVACETYLMVGAMTVFAFCVVVDVICRKLFGVSLDFMQELGKYLMVWATFIGATIRLPSAINWSYLCRIAAGSFDRVNEEI